MNTTTTNRAVEALDLVRALAPDTATVTLINDVIRIYPSDNVYLPDFAIVFGDTAEVEVTPRRGGPVDMDPMTALNTIRYHYSN